MGEARRKKLLANSYVFRANFVLIIEWLDAINEQKTGRELADFLRQRGVKVKYVECATGSEVVAAVVSAAQELWQSKDIPILHIEAHGHKEGLAPSEKSTQFLEWKQLERPMRDLNIMSRFNLILVCAACYSFHITSVFSIDNVAPFAVAYGFNQKISLASLRAGMRELYRQLFSSAHPTLNITSDSANRELYAGDELLIATDCRRMGRMIVEGTFKDVLDPVKRAKRIHAMQGKFVDYRNDLPFKELEKLLIKHTKTHCQEVLSVWYAYNLFPENRRRFSFDIDAIFEEASRKAGCISKRLVKAER